MKICHINNHLSFVKVTSFPM